MAASSTPYVGIEDVQTSCIFRDICIYDYSGWANVLEFQVYGRLQRTLRKRFRHFMA